MMSCIPIKVPSMSNSIAFAVVDAWVVTSAIVSVWSLVEDMQLVYGIAKLNAKISAGVTSVRARQRACFFLRLTS